ncbi:CRISPR-associated helicase Cas3' [Alkalicella caledoniensis]|uniref:CRISPR-associated helicase Cas3 n=1 Tax=Alkalicella caledoniensis TaxID=2731377 RepID=A0A7G9W4W9_ALKCA|nr:CRISPR-associated helicase Cas3' [Alkalicella caledoniensis]QNO13731.1 CRISPR-associated helicase Cas3' [Alkalicella caledoniensis]
MEYLAKSEPKETIQEHTENLIKNYTLLKTAYPNLNVNWDMLFKACVYHDLGKMNFKFQEKIQRGKREGKEIHHGILSLAFLGTKELRKQGYTDRQIKILAHSIAYHHDRDLDYDFEELAEEIESLKTEAGKFNYQRLDVINVKKISAKYFSKNRIYMTEDTALFFEYVLLKGLLNRIDYAASAHIDVEIKNNFLLSSLNTMMEEWKMSNPVSTWNELQSFMLKNSEKNVVAIAETGMGKTEAGLLWIGDNKGFFTLPLKTAINSIYSRIATKIVAQDYQERVGLLHSDTYSEYIARTQPNEVDVDEYFSKTKQLSLPLTVCTLDQIFDFVYRYRGFESKLATLSYSKVVIDEVQMYSPDLVAYLILGLYFITKVGGKFAILTATLPSLILDLLREENIDFLPPQTFTNDNRVRHSIKVIEEKLDVNFISNLYDNNKILIICNTVKESQRVYSELVDNWHLQNVNLFHSGFIKKHRKEKEEKIIRMGDRNSPESGIWVTTQIVEASLDIDFDILVTELSDINGLFQRLGRCYRGRNIDFEGYNCFVFDGGSGDCTGVGHVIDKDIFRMSKRVLKGMEGKLKESEKMDIVKNLYTTDNLRNTEYYKMLKNNMEYVRSIEDYEMKKDEMRKRFRNINAIDVIPKIIAETYADEIEDYIIRITKTYSKEMSIEEKRKVKKDKVIARNLLREFTVSVPYHRAKDRIVDQIDINEFNFIPILNCNYSKERGVEYTKEQEANGELVDNFF